MGIEKSSCRVRREYEKRIEAMIAEHEETMQEAMQVIDRQQEQIVRLRKENEALTIVVRRLCE